MIRNALKDEVFISLIMVVLGLVILVCALLSGDTSFGMGMVYLAGGLFINFGVRRLMYLRSLARESKDEVA